MGLADSDGPETVERLGRQRRMMNLFNSSRVGAQWAAAGRMLAVAATAACAQVAWGQGYLEQEDPRWVSSDPWPVEEQPARIPPQAFAGDRRALRPPTTIVIPDPASQPLRPPQRSKQSRLPAQPAPLPRQQVPAPDVDPYGRWVESTASADRARRNPKPAPRVFAIPEPQILGGPRARGSAGQHDVIQDKAVPSAQTNARISGYRSLPAERAVAPVDVAPQLQRAPTASETRTRERPAPEVFPPLRPAAKPPGSPDAGPMQSRLPAPATLPRQPAGFGHDSGLGAGDSIRVNVFGQPDLATETVVGDDGSVSLPLIDRVQVAGLSTQQASDRVAAAYESGGFLKQPQVNITIEELRSRQISVLGSVASPGRFPLESSTTVLDALALAGGITAQGSRTVALVRRGGDRHQRYSINLDQLLTAQNTGTIDLQAGDTIYVPVAPKFYIYGEVRRPDAYPLPESITVMQAISLGGGLTDRGSDSKVKLKRTLEDGRTVTRSVGLEDRVQPDDVIVVKERLF